MKACSNIPHLEGIRGYASLGVLMTHLAIILFPDLDGWPSIVTGAGRHCVTVFFVLSAYTIALSLDRRPFNLAEYVARRFFRIAPAYYFVILIAFFFGFNTIWGDLFNTPFELKSFIIHITFTNFLFHGHQTNVLGVEYTLAIEVFYYTLLPLMIAGLKSKKNLLLMFSTSIALLFLPYLINPPWDTNALRFWRWSPAPYLFCFVVGIQLFIYEKKSTFPDTKKQWFFTIALLMIFGYAPDFERTFTVPYYSIVTIFLIIGGSSDLGKFVFSNNFSQILGKYSYSIYLVHEPIIDIFEKLHKNPWTALLYSLMAVFAATVILHKADSRTKCNTA